MTDPVERHGDKTIAEALRIAEAYLVRAGWRFGPDEIGKTARAILAAMGAKP